MRWAPAAEERSPGAGVTVTLGRQRGTVVLKWAIIFAIVAVIAGALGFGGVAGTFAFLAKALFFLFAVVCILFLVLGFTIAKKV